METFAKVLIGGCVVLSTALVLMSVKHHVDIGTFTYIAQTITKLLQEKQYAYCICNRNLNCTCCTNVNRFSYGCDHSLQTQEV